MEKPACNDAAIEQAALAIPAARKANRIVQVGTEQRSWPMFGEARELISQLGGVTHVVIQQSGGGGLSQVPQGCRTNLGSHGRSPRRICIAEENFVPALDHVCGHGFTHIADADECYFHNACPMGPYRAQL
jgi:hypothetical protein